ncbi:hypothetical protein [Halomonas organivorans]|uniref:Morphogenetic protein n=1 Tax=Halomonas organivorans TaxID=257772 RepID=A0A7W5BZY2_9GAMM|nr:hypothetical protein [Halomonas organivorans]MBB3142227.1 hypothetical protein [Halomonas organivorans]
MKERPILFNDEMVRALLDGRKTQTRRLVKPQPPATHSFKGYVIESSRRKDEGKFSWGIKESEYHFRDTMYVGCPYGQPGDRLWVREAWQGPLVSEDEMMEHPTWAKDLSTYEDPAHCSYRASGDSCEFFDAHEDEVVARWRPSIHMPRWACRILLEVTAVRVERLQDISETDALAEGVDGEAEAAAARLPWHDNPRRAFRFLWKRINGPDSWDANPWVWVVEFRRLDAQEIAA